MPAELPGSGIAWLREPLAPGDYRLELRHEGEELAIAFTIVAGKLTDAVVAPE